LPPWVRVALGSLMHVGTLVPSSATKIVRDPVEKSHPWARGLADWTDRFFSASRARAGLLVAAAREGRVAVWGAPCSEACRRGHCPAASLFLPPPTTTATRLSVASGCQEPAAREAAGALLSPPRRPGKRKTLEERQWRGRPAQNYFNLFFDGSGVGNRSINLTQLLPVWCITSNHRCAERRFRGPIEQGATCIHHYRRPALERGNTKPKKTIP
jgi:hypothetical protein